MMSLREKELFAFPFVRKINSICDVRSRNSERSFAKRERSSTLEIEMSEP